MNDPKQRSISLNFALCKKKFTQSSHCFGIYYKYAIMNSGCNLYINNQGIIVLLKLDISFLSQCENYAQCATCRAQQPDHSLSSIIQKCVCSVVPRQRLQLQYVHRMGKQYVRLYLFLDSALVRTINILWSSSTVCMGELAFQQIELAGYIILIL